MHCKLIWRTEGAERLILYMARVSNPKNQDSEDTKLINYLIKRSEWSPFDMCNLCVGIETSRAVGRQILRHTSMKFQEFSQRYAEVSDLEPINLRRQDTKNRQNSTDDLSEETKKACHAAIEHQMKNTVSLYNELVKAGVAKECARMVLPEVGRTRMYVSGTIRSWIHYLQLRTSEGTQREHREVAEGIKEIFIKEFPIISTALGWLDAEIPS